MNINEMSERENQLVENNDALNSDPKGAESSEITPQEETKVTNMETVLETTDEKRDEFGYNLEAPAEEAEDEHDLVDENTVHFDASVALMSIEEIIPKLKELLQADEPQRKEVEDLKTQFYRALRTEIDAQKTRFLEEGGEDADFVANEPELYAAGKQLLQQIREKRAELFAQQEAEKERNVTKKLAIIDKIKELTENPSQEDFNKTYQEFKALQQEWNEIKQVPAVKANELWKSYQVYVEKFYDIVRINNEFREYDFRKNLELKSELIEAVERLHSESDIVSAFHQLQNLHQQWREIGPVAKKDREEIWARFKEASTVINKKHQAHFEALKEKENENLEKKTALCEQLEQIDYTALKTSKEWGDKLQEILAIQNQWREVGYVPKKLNSKIYTRYREACDVFFKKKNEFYKAVREELDENLKKKIELCERAESLKDSKDWRKTTQDMIEIQKEWKKIGPVPRKFMDTTWKRFIAACDYFFEQKKLQNSSRNTEEVANMEAKNAIIEKIKNLDVALAVEEATSMLRDWMSEFHKIGHVPFKQKDKVYKEFFDAVDAQFNRLNIHKSERKLENFMVNLSEISKSDKPKNQLFHERERLMSQYDRKKNELQTYENNIGFLSISSKKGNSLLDEMNHKIKNIKSELELIAKKIDLIDKEL